MRVTIVLLCLSMVVALAESGCPGGWTPFRRSCYYVGSSHLATWAQAEVYCKAHGGHLVHINDATEDIFVRGLAAVLGNVHVWLGATDLQREGTWISSTTHRPLTYFGQWNPGQPDNAGGKENCLELFFNFRWNDYDCNQRARYICEKRQYRGKR